MIQQRHEHRMTRITGIFIAFILALLSAIPAAAFEVETYMVPMRDGVKLATDVYLPRKDSKDLPVILMRTPYGKQMGMIFSTTILSKRFAWVVQDTRGRFDSEGISHSFLDDAADGYDTIDWIVNQPWCNGQVGTTGISAMGITQYVMAADPHPNLESQYVMAAAGSLYHDAAYIGGGFRRSLVLKWVGGNDFPVDFLELVLQNYNFTDMWKSVDLQEHVKNIKFPMLHMAGWYDIFLNGNIRAYQAVQARGGEGARGRQRLIIGPWTHQGWCGLTGTKQGQLVYPQNSKYNMLQKMMPWFEETMMHKNRGFANGPAVEYYTMGDTNDPQAPGNEWRTAEEWPPPSEPIPYYFISGGDLSTDEPGAAGNAMELVADPNNPVQSIGGANLVMQAGPYDQRDVEKRDDVLVFTSSPLEEPLEVTGPLSAVLFVSTDVPDTDYAVRLTDVYPDGRSMLVADGLVRAGHRNGCEALAPPLEEGEIYKLVVDVTATSIIFNKGHRIRVSVSGSNFPRFDINLNNGKFFDLEEGEIAAAVESGLGTYVKTPDTGPDTRIAHSKLYTSGENASYFLLPVVD